MSATGRQPNDMTVTPAVLTGTQMHLFDDEACVFEFVGKAISRIAGPDCENAARTQCGMGHLQPSNRIKTVIGETDQPVGSVVDIQQDCVKSFRRSCDKVVYIANFHCKARIGQRVAKQVGQRSPGPIQNLGDEFGNDYAGICGQDGQCRDQRKSHAEPADQQLCVVLANALAGERCQGLLGPADPAYHQLGFTILDREIVTPPAQEQLTAARNIRRVDQFNRQIAGLDGVAQEVVRSDLASLAGGTAVSPVRISAAARRRPIALRTARLRRLFAVRSWPIYCPVRLISRAALAGFGIHQAARQGPCSHRGDGNKPYR